MKKVLLVFLLMLTYLQAANAHRIPTVVDFSVMDSSQEKQVTSFTLSWSCKVVDSYTGFELVTK